MIKKLSIPLHPTGSFKGNKKTSFIRQRNTRRQPEPKMLYTLNGIVKRHPDGFGFFIPEDSTHPDVYLPRRQMHGVMSNDKVKIAVFERRPGRLSKSGIKNPAAEKGLGKPPLKIHDSVRRKDLFSGKILQLLHRAQEHIVGQYLPLSDQTGLIQDDSFQWGENLKIQLKKNQKIKKREWVQAKILHWPNSHKGFSGEVVCSLGLFPQALEDNIRVVQKHHIPASFPANCLSEAEAIPEQLSKEILDQRTDLRSLPFVTIDGNTAQDFDDAIHVSSHPKGWTLHVAIADVSHYVKQGSAMDKEAFHRGNSNYFPGFTLPMLPEKLSNHLCSLKPGADRLAFVVEIHFNTEGERENAKFYPAVINSQARLNYGSAQEIIEQADAKKTADKTKDTTSADEAKTPRENKRVVDNVLSAEKLARYLLEQRLKKHFINLDIPETEISLNPLGEPMDITQSRRLFSHQLIEELMLSANKAVAEYLQKRKIPSLYRVHDLPKPESLKFLEMFAQNSGVKTKLVEPHLQQKISSLIQQFSNHPLSEVVQTLILRSFSQAVYSPHNKNHFGLNVKHYTHFTSPIRRYSDLIVHRILKVALTCEALSYKTPDLASIAEAVSACEQRSVKAERQVKDIKRARFIKKYLGEEMEGMISACTRFGFFVKLRLYDVEGLVHINSLKDQCEFDPSLLELVSKSTGRRFKMGDLVAIQIMTSNIDTGQIDFELKAHKGKKVSKKIKKTKLKAKSKAGKRKKRSLVSKREKKPQSTRKIK